MDANLIYEKTPAGEDAVRQRTRVVQRNTRMVLILVDGKSSVGELCEKAGNAQMVESALQDLERDGLVEPKLARDSVWEQSKRVAEEIRNAAAAKLGREVATDAVSASAAASLPPFSTSSQFPLSGTPEPFSIAPMSVAPHSVFPGSLRAATPVAEPEPAAETPREGVLSRFTRRVEDEEDVSVKPIKRGARGPYISMPLAVTLGIGALLVVLVLVFVLYPYDRHRPGIEAALTTVVGAPVKIGAVHATFTPKPVISAEAVVVEGAAPLRIAHLRMVPEVFSLFGGKPAFSSVEINSATFSGNALGSLQRILGAAAASTAPFRVEHVLLAQFSVDIAGLSLSDLNGDFSLTGNPPETIHLANADRTLRIALKPQASGYVADIEGFGWRPAPESVYLFDSIQAVIASTGGILQVRSLDGRIFDGAVEGTLAVAADGGANLAGDIAVKRMNVSRLSAALGYPGQFEGELNGTLKFSGASGDWSGVLAAASGNGEVTIARGVLGGFDLVEAVRRTSRTPVRGGSTRYEQLVGKLKLTPQSIRFQDLALTAGVLRAGGALEVTRDRQVGGRLDVEMRGSASVVRMPVSISGPLREPTLQASR